MFKDLLIKQRFLFHQGSGDFDLEELDADFVAPMSASKVCSAASAPTTVDRQVNIALIHAKMYMHTFFI